MIRASRTAQPLVIAFIDIDGLKSVNDGPGGHAAGDRLITEVAATLVAGLRPYDLVIRYGGDEFLCVLPGLTAADATRRFDLIRTSLAAATEGGSVSVGIATLAEHDLLDALVARADAALYQGREQRRSAAAQRDGAADGG